MKPFEIPDVIRINRGPAFGSSRVVEILRVFAEEETSDRFLIRFQKGKKYTMKVQWPVDPTTEFVEARVTLEELQPVLSQIRKTGLPSRPARNFGKDGCLFSLEIREGSNSFTAVWWSDREKDWQSLSALRSFIGKFSEQILKQRGKTVFPVQT
ncbi:MAG: hypothetical protein K1Y36_10220 [Blastocatellia bacterium]|nr:hypothetical protein [Blastocatellia bacterium]